MEQAIIKAVQGGYKEMENYTLENKERALHSLTDWQYHWHRFIAHLIAGKDVDSFFNDLLK